MIRKTVLRLLLVPVIVAWAATAAAQAITSHFSPRPGCQAAIAAELDAATCSIDICLYYFTNAPLAQRFAAAQARDVQIRCILDKSQERPGQNIAAYLLKHRVPLRTDRAHKIQHNKYAIIDGDTVITGSFNWTKSAETANAENIVIIADAATATAFAADFTAHWNHSNQYVPRKSTAPIPRTLPFCPSCPEYRPR